MNSSIIFPTLGMERENRSLAGGSVSTKEFQDCLWEGLGRVIERERTRGEDVKAFVFFRDACFVFECSSGRNASYKLQSASVVAAVLMTTLINVRHGSFLGVRHPCDRCSTLGRERNND